MNELQQLRSTNTMQQLNASNFQGFTSTPTTVRFGTANGQTIAELVLDANGQYSQVIPAQLTFKDNRTYTSTATSTTTIVPQQYHCFKQSRNGK
ncbi:unnamed protein product, partial [Nesidiocoris tenuis]